MKTNFTFLANLIQYAVTVQSGSTKEHHVGELTAPYSTSSYLWIVAIDLESSPFGVRVWYGDHEYERGSVWFTEADLRAAIEDLISKSKMLRRRELNAARMKERAALPKSDDQIEALSNLNDKISEMKLAYRLVKSTTTERDRAIQKALKTGLTPEQVSRITNMSTSHVYEIKGRNLPPSVDAV